MSAEMTALTGLTPVGHLFKTAPHIGMFDGDSTLQDVLEYFSHQAADAVIITEKAVSIGIVTLKDAVKALQKWENLMLPVRNFMTSPLHTFDALENISDVIEFIHEASFDKIVIREDDAIIGMMDRRDLLSLCYSKISPLLKHQYHLIHSLVDLVDDGEKRLLRMATTDALTGIGNRRMFEEVFQTHQKLSGRYGIELYLLMLDIDDFKCINDVYGHNVGDSVLKQLTTLVSSSIRTSDILVRWGGEEFAILLRSSDLQQAADVAEQLRQKIDEHPFDTIPHLTCSFGVTSIHPHENIESVFERADRALYRAKYDGKNTVRTETAPQ
ncbi:MAG: diguanylate cyclase [Campylobacterales bacterium]|nr:diguanylate cyclase [Campylobacterales bacterium]